MALRSITADDIARLGGISTGDVEAWLSDLSGFALQYRVLEGDEHDAALEAARQEIERPELRISGAGDQPVWERGWGGILEDVRARGFSRETLCPQYFSGQMILRLFGRYILAENARFVTDLDILLRRVFIHRFLSGAEEVVEFGCGTGLNVLLMSEILPDAKLTGTDWAVASQEILEFARDQIGPRIHGTRFDMRTLEGRAEIALSPSTTVLTVHALEQLGPDFGPFLDYVRGAKPRLCVHFEPMNELYDPADPLDAVALRYHEKRNYLWGFLDAVRALADEGQAEILTVHRFGYGSHYHEAYNALVWRPL